MSTTVCGLCFSSLFQKWLPAFWSWCVASLTNLLKYLRSTGQMLPTNFCILYYTLEGILLIIISTVDCAYNHQKGYPNTQSGKMKLKHWARTKTIVRESLYMYLYTSGWHFSRKFMSNKEWIYHRYNNALTIKILKFYKESFKINFMQFHRIKVKNNQFG